MFYISLFFIVIVTLPFYLQEIEKACMFQVNFCSYNQKHNRLP